jgi:hypothetical protein
MQEWERLDAHPNWSGWESGLLEDVKAIHSRINPHCERQNAPQEM